MKKSNGRWGTVNYVCFLRPERVGEKHGVVDCRGFNNNVLASPPLLA